MHELGITRNIISIVSEHAKEKKVQKVLLEIGQFSAIMSDAIRFCFDICAQDTVVEGALLEIREIPGIGECCQCGEKIYLDKPFGVCKCGSVHLDLISGQDIKIREIEVEEIFL